VIPATRQTKGLSMPMILLATTQELRGASPQYPGAAPTPLQQEVADDALRQVTEDFLKREERALHETVGPHGERLDSPEGRCVNPGHSIEVAWFMLHEAAAGYCGAAAGYCGAAADYRGARHDETLARTALQILDWSLEWGWDKEYGGLFYFVDIEGLPPEQLEWDMKLWWPHTEALYATLLAYHVSGEERYLAWHERLRAYSFAHFSDPEHGEWYGYLHRDGTVSNTAKGGMWKGAFHTPRALWLCWRLLEQMQQAPDEHPFRS
jgi:N-acylglucosamine 2-epimerase